MILDERLEFADAVSVAAAASTALIGSQIDLGAAGVNPGAGRGLYLVIRTAVEIITGGVAGTIQFKLASDSTAAISTTTSTIHLITPEYVTDDDAANDAQLNAGGTIYQGMLPEDDTYEQFLGILAVIATTTVTAGSIDAFLTFDVNSWKSYPDAAN